MLLAACLLAAAPAVAEGLFGGPPEPGQMPSRFIRFDAIDAGFLSATTPMPGLAALDVADITCVLGRARLGIALADFMGADAIDDWWGGTLLPVHIGYTLWTTPKKTAFFYGVVPDVHTEATGGWFGLHSANTLYLRAAVCCDVDYYGFGGRLEAGAFLPGSYTTPDWSVAVYAGLRIRLLTFGIGF